MPADLETNKRIIRSFDDVGAIEHCRHPDQTKAHHVVDVYLVGGAASRVPQMLAQRRQVIANSSCGVCGRSTIDELLGELKPLPLDPRAALVPLDVIRALPDRLKFTRPFSYFSRGVYADLLEPYFNRFMEHQLLIARYEDIVDRPREVAEAVQAFIGVTPRPSDVDGLGIVNPSRRDSSGLAEDVRRELERRYDEPNRRLAMLLGSSFPMWGR